MNDNNNNSDNNDTNNNTKKETQLPRHVINNALCCWKMNDFPVM